MSSPDSLNPSTLRAVQRTAAYAVVTDAAGGVLLVRASDRSDLAGRWFLPGGGLRHGEHPRDCVLRELADQTGLRAVLAVPTDATSDVLDLPHRGIRLHTLRLLYDVELRHSGLIRPMPVLTASGPADDSRDEARFVSLAEAATLPLMPYVAERLGLAVPPEPEPVAPLSPAGPGLLGEPAREPDAEPVPAASSAGEVPVRVQRPAAYAVLIDENEGEHHHGEPGPRILLTRLSGSKGTWTLPGGGIDHGEHPLVALRRELYEEAGLPYEPGPLLDIGSRLFVGRAMDGRLEDFQGLRLVYAGSVPLDQPPRVVEVGGSTDMVAWLPVSSLDRAVVVSAVRESYAIWREWRARRG